MKREVVPDSPMFATEWETLQDHHRFMNDKPAYDLLAQKSSKFAKGLIRMFHVNLGGDASRAFTAPVTELDIWTPKSGHNTDDKHGRIAEIAKGLSTTYNGLTQASGVYPGSAGPVEEKDQHAAVLVVGWESKEVSSNSCIDAPRLADGCAIATG